VDVECVSPGLTVCAVWEKAETLLETGDALDALSVLLSRSDR